MIEKARQTKAATPGLPTSVAVRGIVVLLVLVFSKYVYLTSITSYYTFYLIDHFHVSVRDAQLCLFAFTAAIAVGTAAGGPFGDYIGRKRVIWLSVFGPLPFTLALPFAPLLWTVVPSIMI